MAAFACANPCLVLLLALTPGLLLVFVGATWTAVVWQALVLLALARRGRWRAAALLGVLAAVLLARAERARDVRLAEVRAWREQAPGDLTVEGTAEASGPAGGGRTRLLFRVRAAGAWASRLERRTGWIRVYVEPPSDRTDRAGPPHPATSAARRRGARHGERLEQSVPTPAVPPLGRPLRVHGTFRPAARAENPGALAWDELPGGPRVRGALAVRRWSAGGAASTAPVQRLREGLSRRIAEIFPPLSGGFMQAALFGDREALAPRLREVFTRTGTGHIIAISGMNVAILAGVGWAALSPIVRATRLRRRVLCAALLLYVPLGGSSPSVARAAVMAVALLAAQASGRRVLLPNALGFAGLAVLGLQPEALLDPSFQLSFGAVAGLALLPGLPGRAWVQAAAGDVRARTGGGSGGRPEGPRRAAGLPAGVTAVLGGALDLSVATATSLVATLPLTLAYFRHLPLTSLAANLLVVPSLGLLTAGGFAALGASLAVPPLGELYARACDVLLLLVFRALEACAAPRWAWIALSGPRVVLAALGAVATLLAALALRFGRWRRRAAAGLALLVAFGPAAAAVDRRARALEVAVLSVGQGDAIVLLPPGDGAILVDGGPGAASEAVVAFLHERGVRRLARVVATHPDADHTEGLPGVLARVPVDSVHDGGQWGAGAPYRRFLEASVEAGAGYRVLRAGETLRAGDLELAVLWPPASFVAADPYWEGRTTNDASVVLLVRYEATRLLLTGDVGAGVERALAAALGDSLRADVLKVAHHGSRHSSAPELLDAVAPRVALVSAGRGNRHGHPHPEVLARLAAAGARVRRTDREGALLLRCATGGCDVRGHLSGIVERVAPRGLPPAGRNRTRPRSVRRDGRRRAAG